LWVGAGLAAVQLLRQPHFLSRINPPTPPSTQYQPHPAAYYKQIDTPEFLGAGKPLTPVPVHDPRYGRLPWAKMGSVGWGAALLFGPLLGALIVGAAYSAVASKKARRSAEAAAAAARGDDSLEGKP